MQNRLFKLSAILALALIGSVGAQDSPPVSPADVIRLDIEAHRLMWDAQRNQLLAIVPAATRGGPSGTNETFSEIAVINPLQGVVVRTIQVGAPASGFALSPNGSFLYVVLKGRGIVRRFPMTGAGPALDVELAPQAQGTSDAARSRPEIYAIAPLPGRDPALAISSSLGVMVYDGATRRAGFVRGQKVEAFELRPDGQLAGTAPDIVSFAVDAAGIRVTSVTPRPSGPNPAAIPADKIAERIAFGARAVGGFHIRDVANKDLLTLVLPKNNNDVYAPRILTVTRYELNTFSESANLKLDLKAITSNPLVYASDAIAWEQGIAMALSNRLLIVRRDQLQNVPGSVLPAPRRDSRNNIRIPLAAEHMAYDAVSRSLFVTRRPVEGLPGNSVFRIDPATGEISSFYVGAGPGALAVTDDGRFLYVGLRSAPVINRIDVKTLRIESSINLLDEAQPATQPAPRGFGAAPQSPPVTRPVERMDWRAGVIKTIPGKPDVVVVLRANPSGGSSADSSVISYNRHDVVVYDGGVMRPKRLPSASGGVVPLGNGDGPGVFTMGRARLVVDAEGISVERNYSTDIGDFVESGRFQGREGLVSFDPSGAWRGEGAFRGGFLIEEDRIRILNTAGTGTAASVLDTQRRRAYRLIASDQNSGARRPSLGIVGYDLDTFRPVSVGYIDEVTSGTGGRVEIAIDPAIAPTMMLIEGATLVIRRPFEVIFYPLSSLAPWPEPTQPATQEIAAGLRRIELTFSQLSSNPKRARILATTSGTLGAWGNSLLTIDPESGAVESAIWVGSEPDRMVVSGDGRYVYVVLPNQNRIARMDTDAGKRDLVFDSDAPLPAGARGGGRPGDNTRSAVADMAISPLDGSLAVAYQNGTVAIFDAGVRRPLVASGGERVGFDPSGQKLYAWTERGNVSVIAVTARGLETTANIQLSLTAPFPGASIPVLAGAVYAEGKFYTRSGEILRADGSGLAGYLGIPARLRMNPNLGPGSLPGVLAVDTVQGKIYRGDQATMFVYDAATFDLIAFRRLPEPPRDDPTSARSWMQWGPEGLGFAWASSATQGVAINILYTSTIPLLPAPEPSPKTPPSPAGR